MTGRSVDPLIHAVVQDRAASLGLGPGLVRYLFAVESQLKSYINDVAIKLEGGTHPKHRLTGYHKFFIDNIPPGSRVLDIGSSKGELTRDIAESVPDVKVTGVEVNRTYYDIAVSQNPHPSVNYVLGDVTEKLPTGKFDVVTMSAVLEHIGPRDRVLQSIARKRPGKLLIRVPMIERDWRVMYRIEHGVDHMLDDTHCIEYTEPELVDELDRSGWHVASLSCRWSEFYVVAVLAGMESVK